MKDVRLRPEAVLKSDRKHPNVIQTGTSCETFI